MTADTIVVDGAALAAGWLSVSEWRSRDPERVILTGLHLACYGEAVTISATDTYGACVALVAGDEFPSPDEVANWSTVVFDHDGFGSALMGIIRKATSPKEALPEPVRLSIAMSGPASAPALLPELEQLQLVIEALEQRILLTTSQDVYPNVPALFPAVRRESGTHTFSLAPVFLKRLGALRGVEFVTLTTGGTATSTVVAEAADETLGIAYRALLSPVRTDEEAV